VRVLGEAFVREGLPERILSDNGSQFRAEALNAFLQAKGVKQVFIRPAHPWTNGRIERVFRTFKEVVFQRFWMRGSTRQLDRFCRDFLLWHNRDRPHGRFGSLTPNEVAAGVSLPRRALGRVLYFDGRLPWYRLG
jgi:transposase InsO family protein